MIARVGFPAASGEQEGAVELLEHVPLGSFVLFSDEIVLIALLPFRVARRGYFRRAPFHFRCRDALIDAEDCIFVEWWLLLYCHQLFMKGQHLRLSIGLYCI